MTFRFERDYPDLAGKVFSYDLYYQGAWRFRGELLEEWISQGETSLPRLLARFTALERRYEARCGLDQGHFTGYFVYVPINGVLPPLDALEQRHDGVLCGTTVAMPEYLTFDVASLLVDLAGDADAIVELGAGYGLQLFKMFYAGAAADAHYIASDLNRTGLDLGRRLSSLEPRMGFSTAIFDINDPDWSMLKGCRKALIFTHWAMMYANQVGEAFFRKLAAWPGEATLVFIEPLGFQWGGNHSLSDTQRDGASKGLLNANLGQELAAAVSRGEIEPLVISNDIFSRSLTPLDLVSVAVYAKSAG